MRRKKILFATMMVLFGVFLVSSTMTFATEATTAIPKTDTTITETTMTATTCAGHIPIQAATLKTDFFAATAPGHLQTSPAIAITLKTDYAKTPAGLAAVGQTTFAATYTTPAMTWEHISYVSALNTGHVVHHAAYSKKIDRVEHVAHTHLLKDTSAGANVILRC